MKNEKEFKIDFIGIGAPKSGTSWMYFCLKEHPGICMAQEKEIEFFNKNKSFYEEQEWNYEKGLKWYKGHFSHCKGNRAAGEFSVNYLADSQTPELIYKHFPKVKLVAILRNPIDRIYSHYQYALAKNKINTPNREPLPLNTLVKKHPEFVDMGKYDIHLKRYFKFFSRDQIKIFLHDEVVKSPKTVMSETYKFLGVDENFTPSVLNKKMNTTAQKKRRQENVFQRAKSKIWQILKKENIKGYPPMNSNIKEKLIQIYLPHIKELEIIISRDLSHWHNS